jgi:hypothetical protein
MDAVQIALVILLIVFAGAMLGMLVGQKLVPHHVTPETNRVITTSTAVIGTMTALVISLLLSSATSSFSTRNDTVAQLSTNIVRLDGLLRRYGADADAARQELQRYVVTRTDHLFGRSADAAVSTPDRVTVDPVEDRLLSLRPDDDRRRWLQTQALQLTSEIGDARWLAVAQNLSSVPLPFLALVTLWLTVLFATFGLFAPRNLTTVVVLFVCALAVAAAFKVILDMDAPFGGAVHTTGFPLRLSPDPLRQALKEISR